MESTMTIQERGQNPHRKGCDMDYIDVYIPRDPERRRRLLEALRTLADHAPSETTSDHFRHIYGEVKIRETFDQDTDQPTR